MRCHAIVACVLVMLTFAGLGCGPGQGEIDQLQAKLGDSQKKLSRLQTEIDQTLVLFDDVREDWWNADERARALEIAYENFRTSVEVRLRRAEKQIAKAQRKVAAMTRTHEADVALAGSADEVIAGLKDANTRLIREQASLKRALDSERGVVADLKKRARQLQAEIDKLRKELKRLSPPAGSRGG